MTNQSLEPVISFIGYRQGQIMTFSGPYANLIMAPSDGATR